MPRSGEVAGGQGRPARMALLGAEKQAATSAAMAYPGIAFTFVSDQPVIDGWDLPNARFQAASPDRFEWSGPAMAVCPRWVRPGRGYAGNRLGSFGLQAVLSALAVEFRDWVMPVVPVPGRSGRWIAKGDAWHRPDFAVSGSASDLAQLDDPYGCGVVFQPSVASARAVLVVGRSYDDSSLAAGVFEVHGEAQCREAMLLAAETVHEPELLERVAAICRFLGHRGFFSMNWIVSEGRLLLTSMRPVPRAVFGALLDGGIDLLAVRVSGRSVARPGVRLVARQHYSEYQRLAS